MTRDRGLTRLPRGLRERTLPTAKLAARAGWKHLLRLAGRRSAPPDPGAALLAASDIAESLGAFKGLFMKFGQLASYLPAGEPTAATEALAKLQEGSPAFAFEVISKVVEAELGGAPSELFERFDRRPTAAASIGQFFLRRDRTLGLMAIGQRREMLQADRGERQLEKLLETLAVLRAQGASVPRGAGASAAIEALVAR